MTTLNYHYLDHPPLYRPHGQHKYIQTHPDKHEGIAIASYAPIHQGGISIPESLRRDLNDVGPLHPDVVALLRQRKEIPAIKLHRQITGAGLAEAKHLIDAEKGKYL